MRVVMDKVVVAVNVVADQSRRDAATTAMIFAQLIGKYQVRTLLYVTDQGKFVVHLM